jgi:CRP/FNR family transcriptional regulator
MINNKQFAMTTPNEHDIHIVANLLKTIELFKDLDEQAHAEIISHVTLDYLPENHLIFSEGEAGDRMYFIKTGMVKIYHAGVSDSFDQELAILGDGDFFGEMALISDEARNASAKTLEPTEVFIFRKEDFLNLISTNPRVAEIISKEFLERVKANIRAKNA